LATVGVKEGGGGRRERGDGPGVGKGRRPKKEHEGTARFNQLPSQLKTAVFLDESQGYRRKEKRKTG